MTIGNNIRQMREQTGLTQVELGKCIGVTGVTIMRYETGQREPRFDQVLKIAAALDVPPAQLFGIDVEAVDEYGDMLNKIMMEHYDAITASFNKLNALGQAEAVKRIEELTHIDKYRTE